MFDKVKSVFSLEVSVAPKIFKHFYVLSLLASISYGILVIALLLAEGFGGTGILAGLIALILAPITVRVVFELMLVPFKILEELKKLNEKRR